MSAPGIVLRVVALTEDASKQAHDVLVALARKMFRAVVEDVQSQHIAFEPQDDAEKAAMRGNRWKNRQRRVALARSIATRLQERGPPVVVLFHFDGDRPWSERGKSENARIFVKMAQAVRTLIAQSSGEPGAAERLLPITPFYSIEAWTYQNTRRLRHHLVSDREHAVVDAWEAEPASLDEVLRPKDQLTIRDQANLELCTGWPTAKVLEADASFRATVARLQGCAALVSALEATVTAWDS